MKAALLPTMDVGAPVGMPGVFPSRPWGELDISDHEFSRFKELMFKMSGINLTPSKKSLVVGRLRKRLHHYGLDSFNAYFDLATRPGAEQEKQQLVDLLTTNETYFFREPKHFDFLSDDVVSNFSPGKPLRIWSAASSTGEEAYSIAMTVARRRGLSSPWSILGTDINQAVLEHARQGRYSIDSAAKIPTELLKKYCLKGIGDEQGFLRIDRPLRERVRFEQFNLNANWWGVDTFDVIFLRNVMIYFDRETKRELTEKMFHKLNPGGVLIIGHSESLHEINSRFKMLKPSIYRRPLSETVHSAG